MRVPSLPESTRVSPKPPKQDRIKYFSCTYPLYRLRILSVFSSKRRISAVSKPIKNNDEFDEMVRDVIDSIKSIVLALMSKWRRT